MSKQSPNIHDAFFKKVLGHPQAAGLFLREHLPSDVVRLLAPKSPELLSGSFVDEALGQHHSDLLFKVQLNNGDDALAYVLMEHKSSPDETTRLQLLRYIVRILTRWHSEHQRLPLPPVLPLVAYHGPDAWSFSTEFSSLFGDVPQPLRPYLVGFRHALVDFAKIDDRALSEEVRQRAYLKTLKYVLRPDLAQLLDVLVAEWNHLEMLDVVQMLVYIGKSPVPVSNEAMRGALNRVMPDETEQIMASFGQQYFDEGVTVGEAKGEVRGEAGALMRLLEKRFGAVPTALRARIFAADLSFIRAWFDRAVDADCLHSVFSQN